MEIDKVLGSDIKVHAEITGGNLVISAAVGLDTVIQKFEGKTSNAFLLGLLEVAKLVADKA